MVRPISNLDPNQITRYTFDDANSAQRVIIVGGLQLNSEEKLTTEQKSIEKEILKIVEIEKPYIIREIEYKEIEKPYIITQIEYREIEKPVILKENTVEYIKIPEIIKEKEIIYVDKPFETIRTQVHEIIKEKIPNWAIYAMGAQFILLTLLLLKR